MPCNEVSCGQLILHPAQEDHKFIAGTAAGTTGAECVATCLLVQVTGRECFCDGSKDDGIGEVIAPFIVKFFEVCDIKKHE